MQAPQVTVAPAVERVVADWDEFTGHFEAVNSVEVRPRVGGFIERVGFAEGAMVRQGDVLFVIDPRPYQAEVARAEAVLAQARTRSQLAGMEVERAQKLVNTPGDLARGARRAHERSRRRRRRRPRRRGGAAQWRG